jgi:hypothetical protein
MTSLEGRANCASKRVSSLRSLPGRHRKRPAFAVLNGPLMARQSLGPIHLGTPRTQRIDETGVLAAAAPTTRSDSYRQPPHLPYPAPDTKQVQPRPVSQIGPRRYGQQGPNPV